MTSPNPFNYLAIRNTISRYCVALDTKNFDLLKQVFTADVEGVYPFGEMKGVQVVAGTIQKRLATVTTQHALTTQTISVEADGRNASAETYFTGVHFGKGKWEGKEVTAWGRYLDTLVLVDGDADIPGATGRWLISRREVRFTKRLGEEGVMDGE
ncbi:hypothetical protein F4779DRAFT_419236 [Xylariaceae sp. FL0662B]|nr:hypothetical protein F4779DRAFT_419236 [Xylariaceae sp. FL0662B]